MDNYNNLMDSNIEYGNIVYGGTQQTHHQQIIQPNHENIEINRQSIIQPHENNMYHHQSVSETINTVTEENVMPVPTSIEPPAELIENTNVEMIEEPTNQPIESFQPEVEQNHENEQNESKIDISLPTPDEELVKTETPVDEDDKSKVLDTPITTAPSITTASAAAKKKEDEINPNQCRICLSEKNLTDIFTSEENIRISDKIVMVCPAVRIIKNDYLPHVICNNCLVNLRVAYDFKSLCENTDKELRKKLKRGKSKVRRPTEFILIDCNELSDSNHSDDKNPDDDEFHISGSLSEAGSSDSSYGIGKRKKPSRSRRRAPARSSSRKRPATSTASRTSRSKSNSAAKSRTRKPASTPVNTGGRSTRGSANRKKSPSPPPIVENNKRARREIVMIKATEESDDEDDVPLKPRSRSKAGSGKSATVTSPAGSTPKPADGSKPHNCPYCDKSFNSITVLRDHKKIHSDEKPYTCNSCSKTFKQKNNYNAHITKHKDGDRMTCEKRKRTAQPKPVVAEKEKKKKSEFEMSNFGRDLFKCVAPLTTTYWSDSFSD